MIKSPFKKKILKITAYFFGSLLVLLTAFHFWFVNHAEQLLEELVSSRSNGKLKLHVKKFRFNWFSNNMQLRNAVFYSADTGAATAYRFSVERINVRVKDIYPLVFEKKIVIDSLSLINPDILVTRLRSLKDTDTTTDKSASLPREMGKVYTTIQDALEVLKVNRFRIYNGKFTLVNKMQPDDLPVTITHIQFHLDNLQVDTSVARGNKKILFSDNVALQTHHQDILFPDGRHRLSFSNFRINVQNKRVEFDSCTITASKGDSTKSSFRVFFDKLLLTNINFDTLYQKEIIKADSVYCINPQFRLDVELEKRTGAAKPPPKLDELIQQLTGDLELKFVVVQNGSFDINTVREGKPSSFTSNNNNFELQGLRIQKNDLRPLTVKSFAMAIRNYENFLRDSTFALQFDSILLNQKGIYLSNFSLKQMQGRHVINSFSMPQFELKGLSWDALVFEQKLAAERATLYSPVINYSIAENNNKQDIFKTLAGIENIIQLNNLDIANGKINIHFKGGAQLQLENASMSLLSQNLVASNRISNLQRSVRRLRFGKGSLIAGNLRTQMEDVELTGNNGQITAARVFITNKQKNMGVDAKKVVISSMQIDNKSYITEINGIQWQEAEVKLAGLQGKKNLAPDFILRNIRGANTKLVTSAGNQTLTAFFETLSADEFAPRANDKPAITNLRTSGKDFLLTGNEQQLTIDRFAIADHQHSVLSNIRFINNTSPDSVSITIPSLDLTPNLNAIIGGSIFLDKISIDHPVIRLKRFPVENQVLHKEKILPPVTIGKITIKQPDISLDQPGNPGFSKIEWRSREGKNNSVELINFKLAENSSVSADNLLLSLHNFSFTAGEKTFNAGNGEITTSITDFSMKLAETGDWDWQGKIKDLLAKDFVLDGIGKNAGKLEINSARLNNLAIGSATLLNPRQLVKENTGFRVDEITGKYNDSINRFTWQNASYDKSSKLFSIHSFSYRPALSKEEFMASQPYQADYTMLQTGLVTAGPFDIDRYLSDTVIDAGTISINDFVMEDFRDKRMPLQKGIIKPLPVNMLKQIPFRFSSDLVVFNNANIQYSEVNEKNNQTGVIRINRLNGKITSINNYSYQPGDSLRINAQAYLMDSVHTTLQVNESYTDSLAGFLMTASISPADPKILNPVLMPLTSIQVISGYVDTLSMNVVGKEHIAMGEMTMFYHDLKIKLLNNNPAGKKSSGKGFLSFLANTLIKNKNTSRTGAIFFERLRNRSVLNYLVKMTLSGVGSSVGVKSNKKQVRRHKKELR